MPRGRRVSVAAFVLSLALVFAACGSRESDEHLRAMARLASTAGETSGLRDQAADAGPDVSNGAAPSVITPGVGGSATPGATTVAGSGKEGAVSATATCAKSDKPIVIGSVGEFSGVIGLYTHDAIVAVRAWVAAVNARGGIACHQVRYIPLDDGGDPARNQALTQELVERDGAVAIVFAAAPLAGQGSIAYLNAHRIPVVGTETASPWVYQEPMFFPQSTSGDDNYRSTFSAIAALEKPLGRSKLASITCIEASICSRAYALAPAAAQKYGLNLVYRAQASLAQPDFTANCQSAKEAGAQVVYLGMDANSLARVARSCSSIGFKPIYSIVNLVTLASLAEEPLFDGLVSAQTTMPWTNTASPGVAEYLAALKQFAPGVAASAAGVSGWTAAKVFEKAAARVGPTPTSADILEGLWAIHGDDINGLTGPLTYHRDAPNPQPFCYWTIQVTERKFISPNNYQLSCE